MSNKTLLTEKHIEIAIPLFAIGKSRIDVADHLLQTDPELERQAHENNQPDAFRRQLAHALRVCDPTSSHCSKKHEAALALHKDAAKEALQGRYEAAVEQYLEFLDEQIYETRAEMQELAHMMEQSEHENAKTVGEYTTLGARKEKLGAHAAKLQNTRLEVLQGEIPTKDAEKS